ncbi:MFS transporter [Saccharopolyspora rosea]|uniref:MFS transporter n=1 Tax=Saccharopolyspora rosea TaxID=524884 RepID=A0ABW3FVZ0_9PSEU|nr:MFS transporter [Saccharopolyspora rosea]
MRALQSTRQVGEVFQDMRLTRRHVLAGAGLFVATAVDSWELQAMVYVAGGVERDLGIDQTGVGTLISALFLGTIPGVLLWGPVADRIGRRRTFVLSMLAYGVLAACTAFAPTYSTMLAFRFCAGLLYAGAHSITYPYFEELMPVRVRGKATVYLASGWPVGLLVATGLAALLADTDWRLYLAVSAGGALCAFVVLAWVPESPYWLAMTGRQERARRALRRLGGVDIPDSVRLTVPGRGRAEPLELLRGRLGRCTALQVLINFVFAWAYWGLQTWLPTLLAERGLSLSSSLGFIALSALLMFPGYVSASLLTARWGRKKVFVAYVVGAGAGGALFAAATSLAQLYAGNFLLAFFSLGAWGVWNTWFGELYPTSVRATAYGWGIAGQRVANAVAPTVIGFLLASAAGFTVVVAGVVGFLVLTAALALLLPETEGERLG